MTKTLNLHPPLSTLKERMKHTPKNRPGKAYWDGPRGNSTYVVKPEQVKLLSLLNSFGLNGITYINAIADFLANETGDTVDNAKLYAKLAYLKIRLSFKYDQATYAISDIKLNSSLYVMPD